MSLASETPFSCCRVSRSRSTTTIENRRGWPGHRGEPHTNVAQGEKGALTSWCSSSCQGAPRAVNENSAVLSEPPKFDFEQGHSGC